MNTLIAYSGRTGTTKKCAEALAALIPGSTLCDLRKEKLDPSRFDAVIVGGCIRAGQLSGETKAYLEGCADLLAEKRLGLYICSMDEARVEEIFSANMPAELIGKSVVHASFGGELEPSRAKGFDKIIVKLLLRARAKENAGAARVNEGKIREFAAAMLDTRKV